MRYNYLYSIIKRVSASSEDDAIRIMMTSENEGYVNYHCENLDYRGGFSGLTSQKSYRKLRRRFVRYDLVDY